MAVLSMEGQLQIVVLEARGVPAKDLSGTSDPYAILYFGKDKKKTSIVYKTLVPVWLEEFKFETTAMIPLEVDLYDFDQASRDDYMCSLKISEKELFSGKEVTNWFPLHSRKGGGGESKEKLGELRLRYLWTKGKEVNVAPLLRCGKIFQLKEGLHGVAVQVIENYLNIHYPRTNKNISINVTGATIESKGKNKFQLVTPVQGDPEPILKANNESDYRTFTDYLLDVISGSFDKVHERIDGSLELKVLEANDLPALSRVGRAAQPFVTIIVGQEQQRTVVMVNSTNPKWDQDFKFFVTTSGNEAILMVMDDCTLTSHTHIGRVRLKLDNYKDCQKQRLKLPLEIFGERIKESKATLTVEISYTVKEYRSNSEKAIFGEPLSTLISRPTNKGLPIPLFVHRSLELLKETSLDLDGIFRISGNQRRMNELRMALDNGEDVDLKASETMHDVTGLLKLFFRELPEPLLTFVLHDKFMEVLDNPSDDLSQRIAMLKSLIGELPKHNYVLLRELTLFLNVVSQHSQVNRMNADNLGIVFGPNLLRTKTGDSVTSMLKAPSLYALMITHVNTLFQ